MLPYTAEVLLSLYGRYLGELWPVALPLLLLTLALVPLAVLYGPRSGRLAGVVLAAGWLWTGAVFHLQYFATINFAAPLYGGLFVLQGLLLAWQGVVRGRLALAFGGGGASWSGLGLLLLAALGYPLADYLGGHGGGLRLAGLAPGPTALFTLGALLLVAGRVPLHLLVLPLAWCLMAGFNGWVLGLAADLALPPLALAAVVMAVVKNRRPGAR